MLPARLRTVTGGLTSPARLSHFLRRLRDSQCQWDAARRLITSPPPSAFQPVGRHIRCGAVSRRTTPRPNLVETVGSRWPSCPHLSGRAAAPGCASASWCAPLAAASTARFHGSLPAGCRQAAQCASSLLTSHFSLLTSHFSLLTSHFSLLTSYFLLLTSYFLLLTFHFSLLTSHFSLLTSVCSPRATAAAARCQGSLPAGCRPAAQRTAALRLSALPPCGSVRARPGLLICGAQEFSRRLPVLLGGGVTFGFKNGGECRVGAGVAGVDFKGHAE
ncbi:MAG: hypothetical protein RLZZ436_3637 [Planctomycetota bacterium]